MRELEIKDGYNVLDNNLLACSKEHQEAVFQMLMRQKERPRFTGGFEAVRFTEWHVEWLLKLKPETLFFAYDTPDDRDPIMNAAKFMREAGIIGKQRHNVRCYVLIGWKGDTFEAAETRLNETMNAGYMPMAMLYDLGRGMDNLREWKRFQREWANTTIVGSKMKARKEK